MSAPVIDKAFRVKHAFTNAETVCGIELIPLADGRTVVIASELRDNPGPSITNAAENVATEVCRRHDVPLESLVWIEFYAYPHDRSDVFTLHRYDRVLFQQIVRTNDGPMFHGPSWKPMADTDWLALGLPARQDSVKFDLGRIVLTANANERLDPDDVDLFLWRHVRGDWGDLCPDDVRENERSIAGSGRLFSKYHDAKGVAAYVITEHDRSVTTVLLPEDY